MRRLGVIGVTAVALALAAAPAGSAPPDRGLFVPGKTLRGVSLGMTQAEVLRVWGKRHGMCRDCRRTTWYFNYRPFEPQGTGVEFATGRVVRAFTVWRPQGWRSASGLVLGDEEGRISDLEGPFAEEKCAGYTALVVRGRRVASVFYVYRERLWAFGLMRPAMSPCV